MPVGSPTESMKLPVTCMMLQRNKIVAIVKVRRNYGEKRRGRSGFDWILETALDKHSTSLLLPFLKKNPEIMFFFVLLTVRCPNYPYALWSSII